MDARVNKPAKDIFKQQFEEWYTKEVIKQLQRKNMEELEESELEPINLSMVVVKNVGVKWLVKPIPSL